MIFESGFLHNYWSDSYNFLNTSSKLPEELNFDTYFIVAVLNKKWKMHIFTDQLIYTELYY